MAGLLCSTIGLKKKLIVKTFYEKSNLSDRHVGSRAV